MVTDLGFNNCKSQGLQLLGTEQSTVQIGRYITVAFVWSKLFIHSLKS